MKKMILLVLTALIITQTSFSAQSGRLFPKVCRGISNFMPIAFIGIQLYANEKMNQQTALFPDVDAVTKQLVLDQAKKMNIDASNLVIKMAYIPVPAVYGTNKVLVLPLQWCSILSKQIELANDIDYENAKKMMGAIIQHELIHANENHLLKQISFFAATLCLSNPAGKLLAQTSKFIAPKIFSINPSSNTNLFLFSKAIAGGCTKVFASFQVGCVYAREQEHEADDGIIDKKEAIKMYSEQKNAEKKHYEDSNLMTRLRIKFNRLKNPSHPSTDTRIEKIKAAIKKQNTQEEEESKIFEQQTTKSDIE